MQAWSIPGEGSGRGLQVAAFLLCLYMADRQKERKRERESSSSSDKATVLSDEGSILTTSFNFNYLLKTLSLDAITSGIRTSPYEF